MTRGNAAAMRSAMQNEVAAILPGRVAGDTATRHDALRVAAAAAGASRSVQAGRCVLVRHVTGERTPDDTFATRLLVRLEPQ